MSLAAGTRLGPYEIVAPVGAGAMGEVYRARDTRLGRDVALKTLRSGSLPDGDRIRRFEIEAKAASLLSHPNIVSIYDVGIVDGQPYIVSELLDGENLRDRLSRGPLPFAKVVRIGAAIADALAAAHARGIVHRDLKPENLFITRDGRPKILDFGIAKLTLAESAQPASAPTVTIMTDIGVAVGTLGYMAPEQVRGEIVDHRVDIFALGAMLYELLTGTAAFRRESRIETVNAVLEAHPASFPETVPQAMRQIVSRCLEKQADERFQSARDLAFALNSLSGTATTESMPGAGRRPAERARIPWPAAMTIAVLAAALLAAVAWALRPAPTQQPRAVKRFSFQPGVPINGVGIALSPDGNRLVYNGSRQGIPGSQLYIRAMDAFDAKPVEGTASGRIPFFSPDGQFIAFESGGKLRKIPASGGEAVALCDVRAMLEGTWTHDGWIVIAQREYGLMRVRAEGGTPEQLTTPNTAANEIDHHAPHALRGGGILFTVHAGPEVFRIAVRMPSGETRPLIDDGFFARYVPTGHVVFGRANGLFAAPFDLATLAITGPAVQIVESVSHQPTDGTVEFAIADDGTLAYVPSRSRDGRSLVWVDRTGAEQPTGLPQRGFQHPVLSRDGRRLAVQISDAVQSHIWMYDFGTGAFTNVSPDSTDTKPIWTRDGRSLTYAVRRKAERHIVRLSLDASAAPESVVADLKNDLWPGAWTSDGRLIYVKDPPTSLRDILSVRPGQGPETLVASPLVEQHPDLSPDGAWIAYTAFVINRAQIFVRPLNGGVSRQITADGGGQPRWSASGREIVYRRPGMMMRMPVQTAPTLVVGKPERLFDDLYLTTGLGVHDYDLSADGKRFLMVKPAETERIPPPFHIVTDWFDELRRRVPSSR